MSNFSDKYKIDWNEVKANSFGEFKPLPEGMYCAKITESTLTKSKTSGDDMIKLTFSLLGGKDVKNKKVFENIMLEHSNPDVIKFGLQKLDTILGFVDIPSDEFNHTDELSGKMINVYLNIKSSEKYGDQNNIKFFEKFNEDALSETPSDNSLF